MERWRHDPWGQYTNDNPPGTTSRNYTISMAIKWTPTFWNPHRSAMTPSQQPTSIRARILGGQITSIVHTGLGASGNVTALDQTIPIPLPTSTTITFSSPYTINNHFRDRNRPADGNFATGSLPSQLPWWNSNPGTGGDSYCGFPILTRNQATIRNVTTTTAQGWFARIDVNQAQIVLEYYDGSAWRIYDTVAGYTNLPITGITTGATENWEYGTCAFWIRSQNNVGNDPQFSGKWDPRTTRWAACRGTSTTSGSPPNNSIIFTLWNVTSGRADSFRYNKPFAFLSTTPNPTYFSRWPNGGTTVQLDVKFADPDGVVRPSDGYLGPNILQNPT
ncbi:MAG: hypothetical protein NZL93_06240, partial [Chthoniobacterales bacterium]|nr:hypothetical protein [Chthoniobacterales bacterium]